MIKLSVSLRYRLFYREDEFSPSKEVLHVYLPFISSSMSKKQFEEHIQELQGGFYSKDKNIVPYAGVKVHSAIEDGHNAYIEEDDITFTSNFYLTGKALDYFTSGLVKLANHIAGDVHDLKTVIIEVDDRLSIVNFTDLLEQSLVSKRQSSLYCHFLRMDNIIAPHILVYSENNEQLRVNTALLQYTESVEMLPINVIYLIGSQKYAVSKTEFTIDGHAVSADYILYGIDGLNELYETKKYAVINKEDVAIQMNKWISALNIEDIESLKFRIERELEQMPVKASCLFTAVTLSTVSENKTYLYFTDKKTASFDPSSNEILRIVSKYSKRDMPIIATEKFRNPDKFRDEYNYPHYLLHCRINLMNDEDAEQCLKALKEAIGEQ